MKSMVIIAMVQLWTFMKIISLSFRVLYLWPPANYRKILLYPSARPLTNSDNSSDDEPDRDEIGLKARLQQKPLVILNELVSIMPLRQSSSPAPTSPDSAIGNSILIKSFHSASEPKRQPQEASWIHRVLIFNQPYKERLSSESDREDLKSY